MKIKKLISLLAATAMIVTAITGAMSVSAISADDGEFDPNAYYTSGRCGENASWLINSDGVLVISGSGEMSQSYTNPSNGGKNWGWNISGKDVNEIVIEDGITSKDDIGFFYKDTFPNISKVTLPPSLTEFDSCFDGSTYAYPWLKDIYVYSKIITDASTIYNPSFAKTDFAWPGSGIIWHVYKGSATEKSLREDLKLTDEDINYISDDEQMPIVTNKTPAELEPLTDTSGPAGLFSKWEWNNTSKTLTFSGKAGITMADGYKKYAETTEHIVIKSGVTKIMTMPRNFYTTDEVISNGAFYGFKALKDVDLSDTLTMIGDYAFYQTPVTKIDLPSTLEYIGFRAFRESNLEQISFPESLNTIEESAFSLSKIKSINLHEGMTIGGGAFQGCESLKEVTVPKNIDFRRTASGGAGLAREHCTFANCTGLEKIVVEDGCKVTDSWNMLCEDGIVENFCQNCTSLKTVIIKGGIDCIMPRAFEDCPLNDVYFYTTELSTITAKGTDTGIVNMESICTTNNPTFHVVKDSTTEQTLKDAGYLTADNTVYIADTTALETAIAEAEAIETDKYTDESVSEFTKAIESAKAVLENLNATQDEVDNAVKAIEDAKNALAEKPDEPSSDNSSDYSSDPSNSSGNNNQSQSPNTPATPSTSAPTTATPQPVTPPTVTTTAAKPAKVKAVKVKAKKKKLNVSWKKVSGATGYEVQYATNNKFTKNKKSVTVKKNKVTLKKLKPKKKYFVKVRAYKLANGRKYFGKWSKVVKKKVR